MQNIASKHAFTPKKIAVIIAIAVALVFAAVFSFANMQLDRRASTEEDLLANMSLHDKICQMMVVYRADAVQEDNITYNLDENPYGGIIYYSPDIDAAGDIPMMLENDQAASEIPLFTVIDEEGGEVSRLAGDLGGQTDKGRPTPYDGCEPLFSMYHYRHDGVGTAYSNAHTIGEYLADYGFNWNLAPVADIAQSLSGKDALVSTRCYSDDFDEGAGLVSSAVAGYKDANVMTCLKHFPGHGTVEGDSHYGQVFSTKSLEQLEQEDLLPFKAGIEAGANAVMLGHITVPEIDEKPASASSAWVRYIRNEMDFKGLIVTDGMTMRTSEAGQTVIEGDAVALAVESINAGVDMILTPENPSTLVKELETIVEAGQIDEEVIDVAVLRILNTKIEKGIVR